MRSSQYKQFRCKNFEVFPDEYTPGSLVKHNTVMDILKNVANEKHFGAKSSPPPDSLPVFLFLQNIMPKDAHHSHNLPKDTFPRLISPHNDIAMLVY